MYLKQSFKGDNSFLSYFLGTLTIIAFWQIIGIIPLVAVTLSKGISINDLINNSSSEINPNLGLILQLLTFVIGCLGIWIAVKKIHKKKFRHIVTTRKSFDFKRALTGAAIWGTLLLAVTLPMALSKDSTLVFNFQPQHFFWLILIGLFILPFQTSMEELLFRGYYMQATAVASKNRWVPLIISSVIFGLLHSMNPEVAKFGFWVAMPNYILTGFILGIAAIMDDGLELSLGMHFANNFLGVLLITSKDTALQTPALFLDTNPTMSSTDTIISMGAGIIFLLACSKIYKWGSFKKIFTKITVPLEI